MIDIVETLRQILEHGSRADQKLAQIVLDDMAFASRASINELASRAEVSEPTVTRFCRALHFDGIREFKFHLAQALAVGAPYLTGAPSHPDERSNFDLVCDGAISAIERLRTNLDQSLFVTAAQRLSTAAQVFAYGTGGSSSIAAMETQHRLFRLGLPVTAYIDGEMQRMTASVTGRQTVILAFSISGHARSVVEAVQIARSYGAYTVAFTAPNSALAKVSDTTIGFRIPEEPNLYKPSPTRYALLAMIDLLALETANAIGPIVLERLRRIKQSLNRLKVNDPSLPIGD